MNEALSSIWGPHTLRLQAGTANKETVNVLLLGEVLAVLSVDAAAVQDPGLVGDLVTNVGHEPLADGSVNLLGLLDGGDLAGADGPDGLVGDDDVLPVANLGGDSSKLALDHLDSLARLALLERLAAAPDDADATLGSNLSLVGDDLVRLPEDGPALRVAEDGPVDATVLELGDADLAGEGAVGLVKDVLGGNLDARLEVLAHEEEVESRRSDHHLC